MKKILFLICSLLLVSVLLGPCIGIAETTDVPTADVTDTVIVADVPAEPFTWQYLATIAGAAAFTLLVVQFFKVPLDKIWKIPTRLLAYIIALITMIVATAFTTGLDAQTIFLAAVNAFIAALTAYGAYELTFSKADHAKKL